MALTSQPPSQPPSLFAAPGRVLRATYNANVPSAPACCALCASLKDKGCTSWQYDANGWMFDAAYKCTLRSGVNPVMSRAKGLISGVMVA